MALTPEEIQAARADLGIQVQDPVITNRNAILDKAFAAPEKPKVGQGAAGEFAGNALRAVTAPLVRTGAAIESGLDQTLGRGINMLKGNGNVPTTSGQEANAAADSIESGADQTLAGQAGTVAGTVAPYLTPAGAEDAGAGFIAKHAPAAIRNTAIGTAQTGDVVQGAETGVGGEVLGALGAPVKAIAKGAYKALAIPMSKAEAKMVQAYKANVPFIKRVATALKGESGGPITADETAFRKGLMGTEAGIGIQAKKASNNLWKDAIKPALDRTDTKVNMPKFFDTIEEKIKTENPELSRQNSLIEALNALREDYAGVEDVSLAKLQDFKKGWAAFVPQKAYQGKDIAGAFSDVKNEAAGEARQAIYGALGPDIKQAYIDHGNLQSLAEWGQTAMTGSKFKGGTGGLINAAKDAILTPVGTFGGLMLYKVGQGMEFVGAPGARYISDLFNEESQPSQQQ
jgi:hypothetical protein